MPIPVFRALQGNDAVFTATLSSSVPFAGSETMTTTLTRGDTQAAVATLSTAWNDPAAKTIDITLLGSASILLEPDSYLLIASQTGSTATFVVGLLVLSANAGGAGGVRSLCTVPQALTMVPELLNYQAHFDQLPGTLEQATTACETYCRRKLLLSDFDRPYGYLMPGIGEFRLDARPVIEITTFDYNDVAVTDYTLDAQRGVITLDRTWHPGWSSGWSWDYPIHLVYRAGYAYLASDLALGYPSVPADLKRACAIVLNAMMAETDFAGPVFGQSVAGRSYQLRANTSVVPESARIILDGYSEANRGVY